MQFNYQKTSGISKSEIDKTVKSLLPYLDVLKKAAKDTSYSTDESCLALAYDKNLISQVRELVQKKKEPRTKEVIVLGIGGSILGAKAGYCALRAKGADISFLDTIDNHEVIQAIETINRVEAEGRHVILNIVSKSGTTPETVANARVLLDVLRKSSNDWKNQVVVTSEPESKLSSWAKSQGIDILPNPAHVGGRYSALSAVALFPLALAGIDIEALHKGAQEIDFSEAAISAAIIWLNMQQGAVIHDMFLFDKDLEDLGKWHRQLVGESLGKSGKGITPLVSIGTADLHSMFQLYIDGPKDKFTTFVSIDRGEHVPVPSIDKDFDSLASHLSGKTFAEIMSAVLFGVKEAYKNNSLPYVSIDLESASEMELGKFFQFKIIEVLCLARLMGVDPFGQSRVEEYKSIAKKELGG